MRQLYLVMPRLYHHSPLSDNGKMVELIVFNKGRKSEEDIRIELDPSLRYTLIAATNKDISLMDGIFIINRVAPLSEASVIFVAEGGNFGEENIAQFSSKDTRGRIRKRLDEVPPNWGNALLWIFIPLAVIVCLFYGIDTYQKFDRTKKIESLQSVAVQGWNGLEWYATSKLRQSYSTNEFPITFLRQVRKREIVSLEFRIVNKSAAWLSVDARVSYPEKVNDPESFDDRLLYDIRIEPAGAKNITLKAYAPSNKNDVIPNVEFSLKSGDEHIYGIIFKMPETQN
jgi:hypothetical protein